MNSGAVLNTSYVVNACNPYNSPMCGRFQHPLNFTDEETKLSGDK